MENLKKLAVLREALEKANREIESEKKYSFESLLALAKREKISEEIYRLEEN